MTTGGGEDAPVGEERRTSWYDGVGISNGGMEERNGNIVYWIFSWPRSLTNLSNLKSNSKKLHSSSWSVSNYSKPSVSIFPGNNFYFRN